MLRPLPLVLVLIAACGPSLQRMQRSSDFYERCYALDATVAESARRKSLCWSEWLTDYSDDAEASRVTFARSRIASLASDPAAHIDLSTTVSEPSAVPSSEPPPPDAAVPVGAAPLGPCATLCSERAARCGDACGSQGDDVGTCRVACRSEERVCRRACD